MKFLKFENTCTNDYVVFLHGWGASKETFLWTKKYFENFNLVYVDFSGFGESVEPEKPLSVFDYAQELKALLDKFKIDSLILVGHSFGGRVAVKFSFLYQNDYLNFKLCLVDSAGLKPRRNLMYYFKILKFKLIKKIAKRFKNYEKIMSKYGSSDYKCLSPVMKETFKKVINEDLSYDAKFITKQTVIIWGKNDKETKLYMAKKFHRLILNSSLHIIDGAGHFAYLDKPQEFLIILDTFVRNL